MPVTYVSDGYSPRADVKLSPDIPRSAVVWADCPVCSRRYVRHVRGQAGRPAAYCSKTCKDYVTARRRLHRIMVAVGWDNDPKRAEAEARRLRALAEVPVGGNPEE